MKTDHLKKLTARKHSQIELLSGLTRGEIGQRAPADVMANRLFLKLCLALALPTLAYRVFQLVSRAFQLTPWSVTTCVFVFLAFMTWGITTWLLRKRIHEYDLLKGRQRQAPITNEELNEEHYRLTKDCEEFES